ncbi:hypothetical protein AT15_08550 [Kosmotoga arenicorallina S304]|uniref:CheW-like domain-containing protein n=1 Tax=Kosmotoga arenicorallina S304 TaxID=1453497 RepID=A0A176K260_9BACT|nr:chemotaxis protein CheW [Kosmotoga arenicorallina]OAA31015.1 hypothetical protein AT15_08550 [Kosmotoga arenicorallina S304]
MTEKLFLFSIGENLFAVELNRVEEVLKVPELFKVPLTPEYIAGVANFRGRFIPVIDLHQKLFNRAPAVPSKELVVCNLGEYVGFLVTSREGIVAMSEENFKETSEELIRGIYIENDREIRLLDAKKLVKAKKEEGLKQSALSRKTPTSPRAKQKERGYLAFNIAGKEFAFPLEAVIEVTGALEPREVPNPPPGISGIVKWRKSVIPVVDTAGVLGMKRQGIKKMLVTRSKENTVAFQVEEAVGIVRLSEESIKPAPAYVRRKNHTEVSGTYSSPDGTLTLILSPDALLDKEIVNFASEVEKASEVAVENHNEAIKEKYLFFGINEWIFGLNVKYILELKNKKDIAKIPRSPAFLAGVVERLGNIVPVINTGRLFSLDVHEELTRLVIIEYGKSKMLGLLTSKLLGIYSLSKEEIVPLSASFEETEIARFIEATARIENRAVFLLKPEKLLMADEAKKVSASIRKYKKENSDGKN